MNASPGENASPLARLPHRNTAARLLEAALECFADKGYNATTTRDITNRAGMSAGSIYVHFPGKADMLLELSRAAYGAVHDLVAEVVAEERVPTRQIYVLTRELSLWHATNHTLGRVGQYEYRSLPEAGHDEIYTLRRATELMVRQAVDDGVAAGEFRIADAHGAARAILGLSIDIARWYSESSRQAPEYIATMYADLVVAMLTNWGPVSPTTPVVLPQPAGLDP